jgi:hypothetical protein
MLRTKVENVYRNIQKTVEEKLGSSYLVEFPEIYIAELQHLTLPSYLMVAKLSTENRCFVKFCSCESCALRLSCLIEIFSSECYENLTQLIGDLGQIVGRVRCSNKKRVFGRGKK